MVAIRYCPSADHTSIITRLQKQRHFLCNLQRTKEAVPSCLPNLNPAWSRGKDYQGLSAFRVQAGCMCCCCTEARFSPCRACFLSLSLSKHGAMADMLAGNFK